MGSSISLTLWAFLGMESAAQNSAAVENPKRDVPLACMFGTLGAAVIYILSTTVIQGIVPNAELAKSTGPFGLAYAQDVQPDRRLRSSWRWPCWPAWARCSAGSSRSRRPRKTAADERMFPAFFSQGQPRWARRSPAWSCLGVVQSLMALMTISPNLSEQFAALVNLAVVTNVLPYIIALSALTVMMQNAEVAQKTYRRNSVIAMVAMVYSVFAIYASGKDAVLGGMLVMAIGFIVWGFIAPRFTVATAAAGLRTPARAAQAAAAAIVLPLAFSALFMPRPAHAQIVEPGGRLTIGYYARRQALLLRQRVGQAGRLRDRALPESGRAREGRGRS